jgi:hypothetical protein
MQIYVKIHNPTQRQAQAKWTYEQGTVVPEQVVEYPTKSGFSA